jgi:hypothetical protein
MNEIGGLLAHIVFHPLDEINGGATALLLTAKSCFEQQLAAPGTHQQTELLVATR